MLEKAKLYLDDKDWGKAKGNAEKAMNVDPKCAEAYYYLFFMG